MSTDCKHHSRGATRQTTASAGISEALVFTDKDTLIHQADLALITTKRRGHVAAIYTPDWSRTSRRSAPKTTVTTPRRSRTRSLVLSTRRTHIPAVTPKRSPQLAALIATELDLDAERLARIRLAGLLHDVGKIGVPDAILTKPGKLTDDEYATDAGPLRPRLRNRLAADLPTEATWVRHHHERYDGRGYPDGLSGEAIPLESRIIFVADAFEAMTSDRPYRKAPGEEYALAELRLHAGTQFDPHIVDALIRALAHSTDAGTLDPSHRSAALAA